MTYGERELLEMSEVGFVQQKLRGAAFELGGIKAYLEATLPHDEFTPETSEELQKTLGFIATSVERIQAIIEPDGHNQEPTQTTTPLVPTSPELANGNGSAKAHAPAKLIEPNGADALDAHTEDAASEKSIDDKDDWAVAVEQMYEDLRLTDREKIMLGYMLSRLGEKCSPAEIRDSVDSISYSAGQNAFRDLIRKIRKHPELGEMIRVKGLTKDRRYWLDRKFIETKCGLREAKDTSLAQDRRQDGQKVNPEDDPVLAFLLDSNDLSDLTITSEGEISLLKQALRQLYAMYSQEGEHMHSKVSDIINFPQDIQDIFGHVNQAFLAFYSQNRCTTPLQKAKHTNSTLTPSQFAQAACKDVDPAFFFPNESDYESVAAAEAICATCPVQDDCLEAAMNTREKQGIWGGRYF